MTDREFLERVERELRTIASALRHVGGPALACVAPACERCRLELLADEAADRALRNGS